MSKLKKKDSRVYICHTYYHVYVTVIKELALCKDKEVKADLILSTMSNNFEDLKDRLDASGIFGSVWMFDEQVDRSSEEVMKYHRDRGNGFLNLLQRVKYTKLLGKLQEKYVPTDLKAYESVNIFCDSDPIGYYCNYKKIRYHALEDGLNTGRLNDQAHLSNLGAWPLKLFLTKLGIFFIENGYSKYCIDYEVNDISANHSVPPNVVEVSRRKVHDMLTDADKDKIVHIFLKNADRLLARLRSNNSGKGYAMLLTEPLCELDVRKKIFSDLNDEYSKDYEVIIKPHPRDVLNYEEEFPNVLVIKDRFPMEVLNDITGFRIKKLVSVITQIENIDFADEIDYLGLDFLDKYEDPDVHRRTERLL